MKAIRDVTVHVYRLEELECGSVTNAITGEKRPLFSQVDTGESFIATAYESCGRVLVEHDGGWHTLYHGCQYYIIER